MNLYKQLWSRIGGRKWTYILRDFYHKFEYFIIIGGLVGGYYLSRILTERQFALVIFALSVGYIFGHLFWGKDYIKNQQSK